MNNFDSVAPFYDQLSTLIFGSALKQSQMAYLPAIKQGATVLILGGGTGWILSALFAVNPTCKVWYIDSSARMINLSKKVARDSKHEVAFILGTEDAIPPGILFDAVITNFYLDLFTAASCKTVIDKIRSSVHGKSLWIVSDFINATWWHSAMLRIMYRFFKIMSGIQASSLCDWKKLLEQKGFEERQSTEFFGGFIKSAVFSSALSKIK
ncbi:MAG TPA: class I SAM-dependent methyltransferase [Chryseolinea sp.]|nr:class I SAM-dependent methyltransferase [Chryseolinea sp.]